MRTSIMRKSEKIDYLYKYLAKTVATITSTFISNELIGRAFATPLQLGPPGRWPKNVSGQLKVWFVKYLSCVKYRKTPGKDTHSRDFIYIDR